jgi:hypothetical protein
MMRRMRFAIKDLFTLVFFFALLLATGSAFPRLGPIGLILYLGAMIVSGLGSLALLLGAIERKAREDDRKQ